MSEQLPREAVSLGVVLLVTLGILAGEQRGWTPWPGYPSTMALLVLSWLHGRYFGIKIALFPKQASTRGLTIVFSAGLVAVLFLCAHVPLRPQGGFGLPSPESVHLLLLVPLAEEFYFRGLLLDHLRRGLSPWWAVVLCTFLFALLHLPTGATIVAGVLSLLACVLVLKSNALAYAIQLHVAWNGLALTSGIEDASLRWSWAAGATLVVIAIGVAAIISSRRSPSHAPA